MKRIIIMFSMYLCINLLFCTIHRVGSSQQYSSVQTAIDCSVNNDTVLVYPGTYYECLDIENKSLTLGSLFLITGDSLYASQTIIDANYQGTALYSNECPYLKVTGLSFIHGSGDQHEEQHITKGGGLFIFFCDQLILDNNIVKYNFAGEGGGMYLIQCSGILSANLICYNSALYQRSAGGLNYGKMRDYPETPNLILDPLRLNSIYMNTGHGANDIKIAGYDDIENIHIELNKFTVQNPTSYHIKRYDASNGYIDYNLNYTCNVREGVVQETEADLYVSTTGDDSNSGLSPDQPLRSIFLAMSKIKADSLHPRTIYVKSGTYCYIDGQENFPISLKANVSLIGTDGYFTMDCGNKYTAIKSNMEDNIKVENIKVINTSDFYGSYLFYFRSSNVSLNNAIVELSPSTNFGMCVIQADDLYSNISLSNIKMKAENSMDLGISLQYKNPMKFSNIHLDGLRMGMQVLSYYQVGQTLPPITMSNLLFENIRNHEFSAFDGSNLVTLLSLTNWGLQNVQPFYLSNISLVNNGIPASIASMAVQGPIDLKMYNSVLSNHYGDFIQHKLDEGAQTALYKNCFFPHGEDSFIYYGDSGLLTLTTENLLSGDPRLTGFGDYPAMPLANSPLIDAGTLDLPEGFVLPETDVAGNPRIWGNGIDIGALERQNTPTEPELPILKPIEVSFYPNPMITANSNTGTFSVKLNEKGTSELIVYNVKGQKVATLMSGFREQGESTIYWNGKDDDGKRVSSGVYFFKYSCNGFEKTEKITIVK